MRRLETLAPCLVVAPSVPEISWRRTISRLVGIGESLNCEVCYPSIDNEPLHFRAEPLDHPQLMLNVESNTGPAVFHLVRYCPGLLKCSALLLPAEVLGAGARLDSLLNHGHRRCSTRNGLRTLLR